MDSAPPPEPDLEPDFLDAVSRAARHVGGGEREGAGAVVRFDAAPPGRGRLLILLVTLALVGGGAAYLSLRTPGELPLVEREEDLRWAVAQVVRRVESIRAQTGSLPPVEALYGLVSELIVYEQTGEVYIVVGRRGDAHVVYDGSVPLDVWLAAAPGGAPQAP